MPSLAQLTVSRRIARLGSFFVLGLAVCGGVAEHTAFAGPSPRPAPAQAPAPIMPPGGSGGGSGGKGEPQVYIGDENAKASIVMRDREGKFLPVDVLSPEEQAFRVFAYTEDQWAKLDAVIDKRNREIDLIALRDFDKVIAARKAMFELDKYPTAESMKPLRELGKALSPTAQTQPPMPGGLVDRLIAEGALEPEKREEIKPVVDEYMTVLHQYWVEQAQGDEGKVAAMAEKHAFGNDVRDALLSVDRQIRVALPDFAQLAERCKLDEAQLSELAKVKKVFAAHPGAQPPQIVERLNAAKAFFYGSMSLDQERLFVKYAEGRRRMFEAAGRDDADSATVRPAGDQ